jgi:SAM-dependent methyltransferase
MNSFQDKKFLKRRRNEDPGVVRSKILNDVFLKTIYHDILQHQLSFFTPEIQETSIILELGSAGGITKILRPEVITCDVRASTGVDALLGQDFSLPLTDSAADLIIAKDVLHHISNPVAHFDEIFRVLKTGASVIYAEPNWNLISRIIFKYFHPEPFKPNQLGWKFESPDPMYSNQALPYIIFVRDQDLFKSMYPRLRLTLHPSNINGLSFLLSGGVMSRSVISSRVLLRIYQLERCIPFTRQIFGTLRFIQLTKLEIAEE